MGYGTIVTGVVGLIISFIGVFTVSLVLRERFGGMGLVLIFLGLTLYLVVANKFWPGSVRAEAIITIFPTTCVVIGGTGGSSLAALIANIG